MVGVAAYGGARGGWEISVPSSKYCCEPKTTLRNVYLKIKKTVEKRMKDISLIMFLYVDSMWRRYYFGYLTLTKIRYLNSFHLFLLTCFHVTTKTFNYVKFYNCIQLYSCWAARV